MVVSFFKTALSILILGGDTTPWKGTTGFIRIIGFLGILQESIMTY